MKQLRAFMGIPTRLGSERLKDKNTLDFGGKPLVQHTIEQAVAAASEKDVVALVSNDPKVLAIGRRFGVEIFADLDPDYFRKDESSYTPCWQAMLAYEKSHGANFDVFMVLQPTSPLRPVEAILNCISAIASGEHDAATTVSPLDPHMTHWTVKLDGGGCLKPVFGERALRSDRSELETHYMLNGAVKAIKTSEMRKNGNIWGTRLAPIITDFARSIHIATRDDFEMNLFQFKRMVG